MAFGSPPRRRLAVLVAAALFTVAIYVASVSTPPAIRLGLLYLIPVLIVTWYAGLWWGVGMTVAALALRLQVVIGREPGATLAIALVNQLAFATVAGIAMWAFRHLRRTQAALEDLAIHDPLTRVLNARAFTDRVVHELDRSRRYLRPLTLLYLDLDDFKRVNDAHGHQTGDAVLRLVADAITTAVRQADVVGRLGGDEFAVLMPETDAALADTAAGRLATGLRTVLKGTPAVTASIGVVSCSATSATPEDLLRRADQAMYEAKRAGKDRVVQVAL